MTLTSESRLGPYEVLSPLGAGGKGKVYRARDSRRNREVAIQGAAGGAGIGRVTTEAVREGIAVGVGSESSKK